MEIYIYKKKDEKYICEMKNILESINSRFDGIEEHISNLEDRIRKLPNQNSKKKNKF